ncbi:GTP-binding protein [Gemmobacter lanyuensis]
MVIETSGLADPGPILHTLLVEEDLAKGFRMDGVVTLVDAAHGEATLDRGFEAVAQVAMADLVVLTKTDLVPAATVDSLQRRLKGIAPTRGRSPPITARWRRVRCSGWASRPSCPRPVRPRPGSMPRLRASPYRR